MGRTEKENCIPPTQSITKKSVTILYPVFLSHCEFVMNESIRCLSVTGFISTTVKKIHLFFISKVLIKRMDGIERRWRLKDTTDATFRFEDKMAVKGVIREKQIKKKENKGRKKGSIQNSRRSLLHQRVQQSQEPQTLPIKQKKSKRYD